MEKLKEWQPIESAPKDGTPILLVWHWDAGYNNTGSTVIMASWTCITHHYLSSHHSCPKNPQPDCNMQWGHYKGTFSHWMPLPTIPSNFKKE